MRQSARFSILIYNFFLLALHFCAIETQSDNVLFSFLEFLQRGQEDLRQEHEDDAIKLLTEYDFIIVGAGTAGCALAARLSENPKWQVLLLEAGGPETLIMDVPLIAHMLQFGEMNWKYQSEPSDQSCQAMYNKRCNCARGKVMGGSSVLNYMLYVRGNRHDYDRWAELGNEGWSYANVLPYFQKFEDSTLNDADAEYVGRGGPVKISYVKWRSQIAKAFVAAAQEDGLKYRDYNGRKQTGVSYFQTTTHKALRWSSNRAYLYPLKGKRSNLLVHKYAFVTKILIEPSTKTAYGVLFDSNNKTFKVMAKREVILSAGAINTPQLLMLSGIGPASHLSEKGIKPLVDLAVGFNLQDHVIALVTFTTNASSLQMSTFFDPSVFTSFMHGKGILGLPGGCEAIAFWNVAQSPQAKDDWPDVEIIVTAAGMHIMPGFSRALNLKRSIYSALFDEIVNQQKDSFTLLPFILRPKSRGRIMLLNRDPYTHPQIYANSFTHPYDLNTTVQSILKAISLQQQPAFKAINAKLLTKRMPTCKQHAPSSIAYWECYVRNFATTIYHYVGTAKMGPSTDAAAVVDARLRVHGVRNLRVVDASIMPEIISGHPNGPVFMIAEKAADMIKRDHNFV